MSRLDKTALSNLNRQKIINFLRENSPVYRAEIARACGLSLPTVMKFTDEFIARGLIREIGTARSTGGKPPALLEFVSTAKYIVGVDVGTTNISVIVMDLSAHIPVRIQQKTDPGHCFDSVVQQIICMISEAVRQSEIPADKLLGIGIGVPGLIDSQTDEIVFSPDLGWKNCNLRTPLEESLGLPVFIDNVTRAMAMGELYFGLGKSVRNFICINLGYGIGAAIVIDGRLYAGSRGMSGEFGHITVEKDGPLCDCGNRGCLEALASANAMSKQARIAVENGADSLLSGLSGGNSAAIDAKMIFQAADSGDALASSIISQAVSYLGIAVGSIVNFLDPDMIILEGGVSKAGDALLLPLRTEAGRHIISGQEPCFSISRLGDNAAAVGAASYLLEAFIQNGCSEV